MTVNTECTLGYIICKECKRFIGGPTQCITQASYQNVFWATFWTILQAFSENLHISWNNTLDVVFAFVSKLLMRTIGNGNRCAKINCAVSVPHGCSARSVSTVFLVVSQTRKKQRQVCVKQHREYRHIYIESVFFRSHSWEKTSLQVAMATAAQCNDL